nr:GAF domain-containing protein [Amycolatopsis anabasis]
MIESNVRRLLDGVVRVAADLSLPDVLNRIVQSSCELVGAGYGALTTAEDGTRVAEAGPRPERIGPGSLEVEIRVRDTVFATLQLAPKPGGEPFTEQDRESIGALAVTAGVAIENATLFERTRRRERWLEASHQVTSALLTGEDPTAALHLIAERARLVAGATVGGIARPREGDRSTLVFEVVESDEPGTVSRLAGITVPAKGTATGLAFTSGKPVVVRQYGDHVVAQQAGTGISLPALVKDLDSAVAVPLTVGEETLGVLMVAKIGDKVPFTDEEVRLAQTFAGHAALAMEFARAEEDRRRLAVYSDRDRIARDLHDLVIQRLFATGLGLAGLSKMITEAEVADRVTGFVHELDRTIRDIRNSIFSLREPAEGRDSPRAELLRLGTEAAGMLGFEPRIDFDGPLDTAVPAPLRDDLIATVREALSNVARHAAATSVAVSVVVDRAGRELTVTVTDDGAGIPVGVTRRSGLANLAERAASRKGNCTVRSVPEGGTTLVWTVPLRG